MQLKGPDLALRPGSREMKPSADGAGAARQGFLRPGRPSGSRETVGPALLWSGLVLGSLALGAAIARGGAVAILFLAAIIVSLLVLVFASSRQAAFAGLITWGVLEVVAYPFLRLGADSLLTFDRIWIVALAACLLFAEPRGRRSGAAWLTAAAAVWLVISFGVRALLTPEDQLGALQTWVDAILLPVLLLLVAARLVATPVDVRRLLGALTVAGTVLAAIAVGQFVFGFELASLSGGAPRFDQAIGLVRVSGPYPVPEVLAVALIVCLAATLCWSQLSRSAERYAVGGAAAGLQLLALSVTFFRAAWLAAAIVLVLAFGLRTGRRGRLAITTVVTALVVAAVVAGSTAVPEVSTRLGERENLAGRLATYEQDLNVFAEAPLLGVGVNRFPLEVTPLTRSAFSGVAATDQPHSSYLGLLAEQGLVGFLPLFALSLATWWLVRRLRSRARLRADELLAACAAAAAVGYLVMSLTLTMLPYGPSNSFLALVLGAVAGRLERLEGSSG